MNQGTLTIGRLARAAGVGIETIRYYQRRELLPLPEPHGGAFRQYPPKLVDRIGFIKRSQELGFSLEEIAILLRFEDGADRRAIRSVAGTRLADVRSKIADLVRIEEALAGMIESCEATGNAKRCPIIATLAGEPQRAAPHAAPAPGV